MTTYYVIAWLLIIMGVASHLLYGAYANDSLFRKLAETRLVPVLESHYWACRETIWGVLSLYCPLIVGGYMLLK
jgi:hypothetical protein